VLSDYYSDSSLPAELRPVAARECGIGGCIGDHNWPLAINEDTRAVTGGTIYLPPNGAVRLGGLKAAWSDPVSHADSCVGGNPGGERGHVRDILHFQ
jgi:hypothetical protein